MHPAAKLVIGVIILIIGFYWYIADYIEGWPGLSAIGHRALADLATVFFGVFGLVLIVIGLIVIWIEYEDLKWEKREKKTKKKK